MQGYMYCKKTFEITPLKACSIKVAEDARVIENTQRYINIALINELMLIFSRLGIDAEEVHKSAGARWNFLPFRPGLVGGYCTGIGPFYQAHKTHKASNLTYHPK